MHRYAPFVAGALALAFGLPAFAADVPVAVGGSGLVFTPSAVTINVGDTVVFTNAGGFHNVVADDGSFRCANGCDGDGAGGNGNASGSTWTARVTFTAAGSVPYHCQIHEGSNMVGTITVQDVNNVPVVDVTPGPLTATAETGASTSTTFAIGNTGTADLTWTADTADADCATPNTVPWLTLAPVSGTVVAGDPAANVDVTLDAAALTPGAYSANICVHSNDAATDLVTVPVQFTVNAVDLIFEDGFES